MHEMHVRDGNSFRSAVGKGHAPVAVASALLVVGLVLSAAPVAAQTSGGAGGAVPACAGLAGGGGSGLGSSPGGNATTFFGCAGAGGGGGGVNSPGGDGGTGQNNNGTSPGGAGGTQSNDGIAGVAGGTDIAGGGGGGGGGGANAFVGSLMTNSSILAGDFAGAGGNGGDSAGGVGSGGGGGGAGGYGAVLTGAGASSNTGAGSITGGAGGRGGDGGDGNIAGLGGAGGGGGIGVYFVSSGATFTNSGTVTGGNGGMGGTNGIGLAGGGRAADGAGGAGVYGAGLTVINSGTITGGMNGDGLTQANAITFTGGANTLTLQAGSVINGNIAVNGSGSLTFNQSTAQTLGSAITGNGSVIQNGTGTLTLTGTNTYMGGTTFQQGTLNVGSAGALGTVGTLSFTGGTLQYSAANQTDYSSRFSNAANQAYRIDTNGQNVTFASGRTSAGGSLTKLGTGTLTLSGTNTYSGGTTITAGAISATNDSALGTGAVTLDGGTLQQGTGITPLTLTNTFRINTTGGSLDAAGGQLILTGAITDGNGAGGALTILSSGSIGNVVFDSSGVNTYSGATIIGDGTTGGAAALLGRQSNAFSANSAVTVTAHSFLDVGNVSQTIGSLAGAGTVNASGTLGTGTLVTGGDNSSTTFSGVLSNGGATLALTKTGTGTMTLSGSNTYTGATAVNGGTLAGGAANTFSAASAMRVNTGATLNLGGFAQAINTVTLAGGTLTNGALSGAVTSTGGSISGITGAATLTTTGGITTVTGINTFAGPTIVNGGTLVVNGSLADPAVNAGGTLTGIGSVGDTTVNAGGTFAPGSGGAGTSMTVNGALALQSGATYLVQVDPATASFATVTGTATLGGATVNANFAAGSYIAKQYTILTAGAVQGTFGSLASTNLPANFSNTLSYDATHAYLNLALNFTPPMAPGYGNGLNINQQNVANTLVNYFNTTGGIPTVFGALNANGLTQVSGETATRSQQVTFDAMTQFMGMMTDPFTAGRGTPTPGALGYADDGRQYSRPEREAFAMFTKAPPKAYEARLNVWTAGFGGSRSTDGNAALGSNSATSSIYGAAVGADYWFSPATVAGFSMAGGGTNFSVANGGSGRSDLVQAGAFLRHSEGSAYVAAAAAYGWQSITTDRLVSAGVTDRLQAAFNANAYSGRIEVGNRWLMPAAGGIGVTPYAAVQVTAFDLPAYAETSANGATTFGLNYAGKMVTETRTELGLRTDKSFALNDALLTLRGRAAWAHDFNSDRSIAATFQSLPGASFTVNGAVASRNAALTSASAEMKWSNGWAVAATFDGEFSGTTRSYAGKGVVRYAW